MDNLQQGKLTDMYTVVVGKKYYSKANSNLIDDNLKIYDDFFVSDEKNHVVGNIYKDEKFFDKANKVLNILRRDNVIKLTGSNYKVLSRTDLVAARHIFQGKVVYEDNDMVIIYIGTNLETTKVTIGTPSNNRLDISNQPISIYHDERKEDNNMNTMFGKMGFGKYVGDKFKLSMNGIAVLNHEGKYVVYNKDTNEFVDTTDMLLEIKDAIFTLPAVDLHIGDTILHNDKPYYIIGTRNEIKAVSYEDCTQTVLIPKTTILGLKYFTKVFSIFGDNFTGTNDLFSNPMMLMSLMGDNKDDSLSKMLLMSSMAKGGDFSKNPMMMAILLKDGNSGDLSTIAMMSMFNGGTNPFGFNKPVEEVEVPAPKTR